MPEEDRGMSSMELVDEVVARLGSADGEHVVVSSLHQVVKATVEVLHDEGYLAIIDPVVREWQGEL